MPRKPMPEITRPDQVKPAVLLSRTAGPAKYKIGGKGSGLYLITRRGHGFWQYQFRQGASMRSKGFGSSCKLTLKQAIDARAKLRYELEHGLVPMAAPARGAVAGVTFAEAMESYLNSPARGWDPAEGARVRSMLTRFAGSLMPMAAAAITTADIIKVLAPTGTDADVWQSSIGKRLRMRIDQILTDANSENLSYSNPADAKKIKGKLGDGFASGRHHPTIGAAAVHGLMEKIAPDASVQSRALQFMFLTATRAGETEDAQWSEFYLTPEQWSKAPTEEGEAPLNAGGPVWIIPASRMKTGKKTRTAHVVPLPPAAVALLGEPGEGYVFPGRNGAITHQTVANLFKRFAPDATVHGSSRASFGEWCQETGVKTEWRELCLGHKVGGTVMQAYSRSQVIGFRREVMTNWAAHCASAT